MKISSLLKFLLAPVMLGIVPDEGGGPTAEELRGDFVSLDDGAPSVTDEAQAQKDAEDEAARIAAEEAAKKTAEEVTAAAAAKPDGAVEDDKKKGSAIPLARHEAVLKKERERREALEAEVETLRQGKAVATTNEEITAKEGKIATLDAEYSKFMVDGETEKAAAKMTEIRKLEREIGQAKLEFQVQVAEARAVERVRYDSTVGSLEAAYPVLNPDHELYDESVVTEVLEMQQFYMQFKKQPASKAIQSAVEKLLGAATKKQEAAVTVTPKVDEEAATKAAAEAARKEASTKKAIDAANKTPPMTAKIGADSDKDGGVLTAEKVSKMDQKQFAQLTDADLAKIRGDSV